MALKNSHMTQLTNSNAQHYVKMLCTNNNKTTINKQILWRFKKCFSQRSKNWNTPFYLQMFCALSGRSMSWNTPFFSHFTSREQANLIGCHFFHSHVLPRHSKAHLLRCCGERSFLGVAKSWKVTLDRVPWFWAPQRSHMIIPLGDKPCYDLILKINEKA